MKVIGVDLGTTNSCVYYLDEQGHPVLVVDAKDHKIFPSAVWSAGPGKDIIVGHTAKNRLGQQPSPIVAVKRKMGTTETANLGGQQVSPVQVSAHILTHAKKLVEEVTNDQVGGAVVTIPAYFDAAPKQDTYSAAVEAFFGGDEEAAQGRIELQLEPEAAAFAYMMEDAALHLRVLVYDLGGGTFDVTILEKSPEAGLTVLKFGGDPHLGGDNVDDRIAAWMLYLLRGGKPEILNRLLDSGRYEERQRYTILQQVLTNDVEGLRGELHAEDRDLLIGVQPRFVLALDPVRPEDLARIHMLKRLAERAKMDLTVSTEALITRHSAFEDQEGEVVDIDLTLSRKDFNRLIGDFVARTIEETTRVIRDSGLRPEQLDRILLVGGSSRMPVIREELEKRFHCPVQLADPDLIVARGAALRARNLNPQPFGTTTEHRITVEYPRQTADRRINIKGQLSQRLSGYQVYISRGNEALADAPVNEDRFILTDIPLVVNTSNTFRLDVVDQDENIFAQADITVQHSDDAVPSDGPLSTEVTKPIRSLGIRGFKTIFEEGKRLPAESALSCYRATQDDYIVIPFYEGERWLQDLRITGVDPSLPLGSAIDVRVTIHKDYTVRAMATVRSTKQTQQTEFKISRIEIPPVEEMDGDLDSVLEQIDNDITLVTDPNQRARFSRRVRRLEADYRKARRELTPDLHHLYTMIGALKKVLIEIRGAQQFLEPPFEAFERLLGLTRGHAQDLDATSPIHKRDVLEKIASLERAGQDAWEREDAPTWKAVVRELEKLQEDLARAQGPGPDPRKYPPEAIQKALLGWTEELRENVATHNLTERFSNELDQLERAARQIDLRHTEQARNALLQLIQERLQPLSNRIDRAISELTGQSETGERKKTTVDWERR
jgi:actin-like ATPase involved in cell morphogenesis